MPRPSHIRSPSQPEVWGLWGTAQVPMLVSWQPQPAFDAVLVQPGSSLACIPSEGVDMHFWAAVGSAV